MENSVIVERLLGIVKPYRMRAALSLLAMAVTATTQPMLTWSLELLLDHGFGGRNGPASTQAHADFNLWLIPAIQIGNIAQRGVSTFATAYLNNWVMSRVLNDLRRLAFDKLLRLPVARFHNESAGRIINTV